MSTILPASGKMPVYRFYITYPVGSISYEVFPLNFLETSLVDELESDEIFYRRKFKGTLLFGTNSLAVDEHGVTQNRKSDWQLFWDIEQNDNCERLDFLITKTVEGATTTYWEGYFSTSDGKIDIDRCTFEVTPLTDDDYTDLLDKADIQYNFLPYTTAISTHAYMLPKFDINYTRSRWLIKLDENSVIKYLADKIKTGVTVSSSFFTDATNYVTLETNHLTLLTIAQKSDIIRYNSSDPAPTALLSWHELMDILWAMFQVKWNYDPLTDTINVEHISWSGFAPAAGIDLRSQLSCVATNKYSYRKDKMPKYEKFSFMEAGNENFTSRQIWYDSMCVNQDPETNVVESLVRVTTDLELIKDSPDSISDDGFVILCNKDDGGASYHVEYEVSYFNYDIRLNMHLSWTNLHYRYFRHNRVLIQGYLNDALTTFWTALKTKIQQCSAIICDDYDPRDEITTELGETYLSGAKAKVETSSLRPTGAIEFNLLYGPPDNEPTEIADIAGALIEEDAGQCGHFHLKLTRATTAELHIIVSHEILDSTGTQVCTGGPETWTINLGDTESNHTFTLCNSIPAGGCVNYAWTYTDLEGDGYIVDVVTECEC